MKSNLKEAVEAVRTACFNSEKITGTQIKKQYGISTHLLPVMIEAGYIQKMEGLKYKWKVQAEILPVMLKVIQDGITKTNMEYLRKSQANKIKAQKKVEWKQSLESHIKNMNIHKVNVPTAVVDDSPKTRPEMKTVGNDEIIKKLESVNTNIANLSTTIHQKWTQMEFKDREIAELKRNRKSIVFRLFGLPIFAISRS